MLSVNKSSTCIFVGIIYYFSPIRFIWSSGDNISKILLSDKYVFVKGGTWEL